MKNLGFSLKESLLFAYLIHRKVFNIEIEMENLIMGEYEQRNMEYDEKYCDVNHTAVLSLSFVFVRNNSFNVSA